MVGRRERKTWVHIQASDGWQLFLHIFDHVFDFQPDCFLVVLSLARRLRLAYLMEPSARCSPKRFV